MSRKAFDTLADMRNVPPDCAEWFWNSMDGANWVDKSGRQVVKVEPLLINAANNWRSNPRRKTDGALKGDAWVAEQMAKLPPNQVTAEDLAEHDRIEILREENRKKREREEQG